MVAKRSLWDRIGIGLSSICLIHCLLLPLTLVVLPLGATLITLHEEVHILFAVLLLPTTAFAAYQGYRRHRHRRVLGWLGTGLALVLLASFPGHEVLGVLGGTLVTMLGSALLIWGHWQNWRLTLRCTVPSAPSLAKTKALESMRL
ncbi:MAG: MerC domain-containing protein [Rhodothermus sp.]|nr:MerC domain-containing protein [Rhodothermus sp.]